MQVRLYTSSFEKVALSSRIRKMVNDLRSSQDLAKRITIRDFKAQYRQSFFGILWAFITPLMSTIVWVVLEKSGVVKMSNTGIPYAAYVFSGTMIWSIFAESIQAPLQSTQQARGLLGKINFPKEAILLSGIYKTFGNASIRLLLVFAAFLAMGILPSVNILFLPVFLIGLILVGFSIGLIITPIGMLYSDIGRATPLFLQLLMYLSPVIYNVPSEGLFSKIMTINPMTPIILNSRNCLSGESFEQVIFYIMIQLIFLIILFIGWGVYRFSIPIIVERSGS
jgi:lipopolysaccharide transport system permease protein